MRRVVAALALVGALAGPVSSQETTVDGVLDSLASIWARSDAAAIAALGSDNGLELEVDGAVVRHLSGRTMVAELRRIFENRETLRVAPGMIARVAGTDDRAFGELTWDVRPSGTTTPERSTIFIGLVREPTGWKVSQIRILP